MNAAELNVIRDALRTFLKQPSDLDREQLQKIAEKERDLSDKIWFNAGWYAARNSNAAELEGQSSTTNIAVELVTLAELVRSQMKVRKPAGRKAGSYTEFHSDPGYQVLMAMDDLEMGGKSTNARILRLMKDGWLDSGLDEDAHAKRLALIRARIQSEREAYFASLGHNVVGLPSPKARKKSSP